MNDGWTNFREGKNLKTCMVSDVTLVRGNGMINNSAISWDYTHDSLKIMDEENDSKSNKTDILEGKEGKERSHCTLTLHQKSHFFNFRSLTVFDVWGFFSGFGGCFVLFVLFFF